MILFRYLFTKLRIFKCSRVSINQCLFSLIFVLLLYIGWKFMHDHSAPLYVPKDLRRYMMFKEGYSLPELELNDLQLERLTARLDRLNDDCMVFNWKRYGHVSADTAIIAIQVHRDVERLQYLIISLGQVRFIKKVLLVFSHSYYHDKINRLVRSIRFTKVMQIFYPYSLQLNPNKFPGIDPNDCNGTATHKSKFYCLDRDARVTEHKQHWWWKANFIFNHLEWSNIHKGMVFFLEESDYVLPDLLYMKRYIRRSLAYFPSVEVLSFGRPYAENLELDLLSIDAWKPPFDRGLAFNKTTWRKISRLSHQFCLYDDFSWSYSLAHLFEKFPRGYVEMSAPIMPRVVSTSGWANGHLAAKVLWWRKRHMALFPARVRALVVLGRSGRVLRPRRAPPRGNGGWSDLRDQLLCLDPLMATTNTFNSNYIETSPMAQTANEQTTKNVSRPIFKYLKFFISLFTSYLIIQRLYVPLQGTDHLRWYELYCPTSLCKASSEPYCQMVLSRPKASD